MALRDLIFESRDVATATPATVATHGSKKAITVAKVATVAVAKAENSRTNEPTPHTIPDPAEPCADCGSG
jgi:hypothetical protein